MRNLLLFEAFKLKSTEDGSLRSGRFKNWKTQLAELNDLKPFKDFCNAFNKARTKIFQNPTRKEIKPVLHELRFLFVDYIKGNATVQGFKNPELGDIYVSYIDHHILLKKKNFTYKYAESYETKHNVSGTQESIKAIDTFLNMIKNTVFTLKKENIPALFRDPKDLT